MKKRIIILLSFLIVIAVMILTLIYMKTDKNEVKYTNDEIKFKDEYESLNGKSLSDEKTLKDIIIPSDNNIKYVTDDKIIDVLTEGSNVIYFGWADCNWCRTAIPNLIDVVKENELEYLYYYDFKSLRDAFENNTNDKSVKIYQEILNIIGKDINTTFDESSNAKGEKKILAPTVVFIKNGNYVGLHFKTVESQKESTDELSIEQTTELKRYYQTLIDQINTNVCTDEGC